ncbi:collagen alpha-1(XI) chain-like [Patiria miniata]|uniref:Thrombospondin-like N-terminal domain-containing protein n=1 Tax=Patiria miniata TaxID=46514 RepID=A0A913Z256_PATMI|nr:collagen alpha-1(XI) chain-like [Patiria miniata]
MGRTFVRYPHRMGGFIRVLIGFYLTLLSVNLASSQEVFALPPGTVDVLDKLDVAGTSRGVTSGVQGMCRDRPTTGGAAPQEDQAFSVGPEASLSREVGDMFSGENFPEDFSILLTVRIAPPERSKMFLFSLYEANADAKIVFDIGSPSVLQYADERNQPGKKGWPRFRLSIADDRWHRIALSVNGQNANLITDCNVTETASLTRSVPANVKTDGIFIFGRDMRNSFQGTHFEGQIQQFLIVPDPYAAFDYCRDYMPSCNEPMPVYKRALEPEISTNQPDTNGEQEGPTPAVYYSESESVSSDSYSYPDPVDPGSSFASIPDRGTGPITDPGTGTAVRGPRGEKGEAGETRIGQLDLRDQGEIRDLGVILENVDPADQKETRDHLDRMVAMDRTVSAAHQERVP